MGALSGVTTHDEKRGLRDQDLPQVPQEEDVVPLKTLLNLEFVPDPVNRVVIQLLHQVLLKNFAPGLHLEMFLGG